MKAEIRVDNLKCHGCANTICNSLQKIEGVNLVDVDVENSMVFVDYNDPIGETQITSKLAQLGYPEQGTTTIIQKVSSYVSCAIGRF